MIASGAKGAAAIDQAGSQCCSGNRRALARLASGRGRATAAIARSLLEKTPIPSSYFHGLILLEHNAITLVTKKITTSWTFLDYYSLLAKGATRATPCGDRDPGRRSPQTETKTRPCRTSLSPEKFAAAHTIRLTYPRHRIEGYIAFFASLVAHGPAESPERNGAACRLLDNDSHLDGENPAGRTTTSSSYSLQQL